MFVGCLLDVFGMFLQFHPAKCGPFFNPRTFPARCEAAIGAVATALGIAWSGAALRPSEGRPEHHGLLAAAAVI